MSLCPEHLHPVPARQGLGNLLALQDIAQFQLCWGVRGAMRCAVGAVRLTVQGRQDGVLGEEAARCLLHVLCAWTTSAFGLLGAAAPPQLLHRHHGARPVGVGQAVERLGIAGAVLLLQQHEGLSIMQRAAVLGQVCQGVGPFPSRCPGVGTAIGGQRASPTASKLAEVWQL